MKEDLIYRETLRSKKTTGLFFALAVIWLILGIARLLSSGWAALTFIFLGLSGFFFLYVANFWKLDIHIHPEQLQVKFGLIVWRVPLKNIASIEADDLPWLMRNGGAGVHFMLVNGLYRVNFNFLEYPRLLVRFKQKTGPVQALSLSTQQPEKLTAEINQRIEP